MTHTPTTESLPHRAAWAGLAHGLGDLWPADVPAALPAALDAALLSKAERLARGTAKADPGPAPTALQQVLTRLQLKHRDVPVAQFVPQSPLALEAALFRALPTAPASNPDLRAGLQAAIRTAMGQPINFRLDAALDAAQRFGWCLPAPGYGPQTDVSRYNHARSVAAVAACLAQNQSTGQAQFALLGADLSGIQAFIYTLASSGAAKSLRARSFYLQLLAEAMARFVLRQLELPITNLLYCGGGGFQILAGGAAVAQTTSIERDLQHRLLQAHRAALGITLSVQKFEEARFDQFSAERDQLGQTLNRAKRRPFASVPEQELAAQLGQPLDEGGELDFCRVTGEEVPEGTLPDADGVIKSAFVKSLERLGGDLLRSTYMTAKANDAIQLDRVKNWRSALGMFGWFVKLEHDEEPAEADPTVQVLRFDPEPKPGLPPSSYYPLARLVPINTAGNIKMFDELANEAVGGFKRWAVLRMDVDNLGSLFRTGLGANASLARTASLSFALRLFFEGWLPRLAEQNGLEGRLYIQYAGGDDVFVVGAWDAVAAFALRIRNALADYAGHNPSVTLSAGIALADVKFPLYQAARLAGEAEDDAKLFNKEAKDAVSFLGEVMSWADFEKASGEAANLAQWCGRGGAAPRSLLQTLQQIHLQTQLWHAQAAKTARERNTPYIQTKYTRATWLAAYQLSRVIESLGNGPEVAAARVQVEAYRGALIGEQAQSGRIALAARWAQFLIRGETAHE